MYLPNYLGSHLIVLDCVFNKDKNQINNDQDLFEIIELTMKLIHLEDHDVQKKLSMLVKPSFDFTIYCPNVSITKEDLEKQSNLDQVWGKFENLIEQQYFSYPVPTLVLDDFKLKKIIQQRILLQWPVIFYSQLCPYLSIQQQSEQLMNQQIIKILEISDVNLDDKRISSIKTADFMISCFQSVIKKQQSQIELQRIQLNQQKMSQLILQYPQQYQFPQNTQTFQNNSYQNNNSYQYLNKYPTMFQKNHYLPQQLYGNSQKDNTMKLHNMDQYKYEDDILDSSKQISISRKNKDQNNPQQQQQEKTEIKIEKKQALSVKEQHEQKIQETSQQEKSNLFQQDLKDEKQKSNDEDSVEKSVSKSVNGKIKKTKRADNLLKKAEEIKIQELTQNHKQQTKIGQNEIMIKYFPSQQAIEEKAEDQKDQSQIFNNQIHAEWREDFQAEQNLGILQNSPKFKDDLNNQDDTLKYLILIDLCQPNFNGETFPILQLPLTIYDIENQRPLQDGKFHYILRTDYTIQVNNKYGAQNLLNQSLRSQQTLRQALEDFVRRLKQLKIEKFTLACYNPKYTLNSLINECEMKKIQLQDFFYYAMSIYGVWGKFFKNQSFEETAEQSGMRLEHKFDSRKNVEALVKIVQKLQNSGYKFRKEYIQKIYPQQLEEVRYEKSPQNFINYNINKKINYQGTYNKQFSYYQ